MPAKTPSAPKTIIRYGFVASQRSSAHPMPPPTTTAPTRTNGNSMAMLNWRAKFGSRRGGPGGRRSCGSAAKRTKRQEERLAGEADKRLGINARHQHDEHGNSQRDGLPH